MPAGDAPAALEARSALEVASGPETVAACVHQLRAWLLSLTAADVSVMIAIQKLDHQSDQNHMLDQPPTAEHIQPVDSLAPGVVHVLTGPACVTAFSYRVAVVDVQPKPPSKVRAHFELDTRLAAIAARDSNLNE